MTVITQNVASRVRQRAVSTGSTVLTLVSAAVVPVLVGFALLGSTAVHRPALGRSSRWWWNPARDRFAQEPAGLVGRVTVGWGIGFVIVGAAQGAAAAFGSLSITSPIDAVIRSTGALLLEAVFVVTTIVYLRHRSQIVSRRLGPP